MIRVSSKTLDKVTSAERAMLNRLTLRGDSLMRDDILHRKDFLEDINVFIARVDGKIVGWSCIFPNGYKHCSIYTYVAYSHRRQGIGKRLLNKAVECAKRRRLDVSVYPWDNRSEKFFHAVGAEQYAW